MRRHAFLLLFLWSVASPCRAADARVEAWIGDLQSGDFSLREKATTELVEAYTAEIGDVLLARRPQAWNELSARIGTVLGRTEIATLSNRLSNDTQFDYPDIAKMAFSVRTSDLSKVLAWADGSPDKPAISNPRDRRLLREAAARALCLVVPDWSKASDQLRRQLLDALGAEGVQTPPACLRTLAILAKDPDKDIRDAALRLAAQ